MATSISRQPPRKRLQLAARELFYEDGYDLSIDAVAERAGVAKGTVRSHFLSVESLISSALQVADEEWFSILAAELELRSGDPLAQLLAPFDLLAAEVPDAHFHDCLFSNGLTSTIAGTEHPARQALIAHEERMSQAFVALATAAGAGNPRALAQQLLLLYSGLTANAVLSEEAEVSANARSAATALLAAAA